MCFENGLGVEDHRRQDHETCGCSAGETVVRQWGQLTSTIRRVRNLASR